ncbi:hypothetical protein KEM55_007720 [Ascosphaera atra]|nr:hypothetical protein KEM55_007720 [Ascosphaera atra]
MLYVNWPRINTPAAAVDGYLDALARAAQDQIVGRFIAPAATTAGAGVGAAAGVGSAAARRARAFSNVRVGYMEEGKKRVE